MTEKHSCRSYSTVARVLQFRQTSVLSSLILPPPSLSPLCPSLQVRMELCCSVSYSHSMREQDVINGKIALLESIISQNHRDLLPKYLRKIYILLTLMFYVHSHTNVNEHSANTWLPSLIFPLTIIYLGRFLPRRKISNIENYWWQEEEEKHLRIECFPSK